MADVHHARGGSASFRVHGPTVAHADDDSAHAHANINDAQAAADISDGELGGGRDRVVRNSLWLWMGPGGW